MVNQTTPGLEAHLQAGPRAGYIGFDPTAPSLHIGNLATLQLLLHFARAGHRPLALVGGATGMIGDPSGKAAERTLQTAEAVAENVRGIAGQLAHIYQNAQAMLGEAGWAPVQMVNNADWFGPMSVIDFLRDVGKTLTVSYMSAKDSVKSRLETGLSFTEFSYQLLQGFDFVHLHRAYGVTLQMGGADQWGNMTSGTEMLRRLDQAEGQVLTTPLVTKADGSKFGKSEGGNVWLDPARTSPYRFYQFWLNVGDDEVEGHLKRFTFLTQPLIAEAMAAHGQAPHLRGAQKLLAQQVTQLVHGAEALAAAQQATDLLFSGGTWAAWQTLPEATLLDVMDGVPHYALTQPGDDLLDCLSAGTDNKLFTSKGEARRFIQNGGLALNLQKVIGQEQLAGMDRLCGKYILGQKGKKNFFLLELPTV